MFANAFALGFMPESAHVSKLFCKYNVQRGTSKNSLNGNYELRVANYEVKSSAGICPPVWNYLMYNGEP